MIISLVVHPYVSSFITNPFDKFLQLAKQGDVEAAYRVGKMFEEGKNVNQDLTKSLFWYYKAAKGGYSQAEKILQHTQDKQAQYQVGEFYENDKNIDQAIHWYLKAAKQNHTGAQYHLGEIYQRGIGGAVQNWEQALSWYQKAAKHNYDKAWDKLYKTANEQNIAEAQYMLGEMFKREIGVEKDLAIALSWYRKAAKQKYIKAQYRLGQMYEQGIGVERDLTKALHWHFQAALQKHEKAKKFLDEIAEQGNSDAQYLLGGLYEKLEGLSATTLKWYHIFAIQKHKKAKDSAILIVEEKIRFLYFNRTPFHKFCL